MATDPGGALSPLAVAPVSGSARTPQLPALTGLRFFAALWVVFGHIAGDHPELLPQTPLGHLLWLLADSEYEAVTLFFVLSGFVLVYSAHARPRTARAFYAGRLRRLGPTYLIALAVAFLPFLWSTGSWTVGQRLGAMVATLTVTQAWFPSVTLAWDGPAWSLSCEAFFYLLFPWLLRPLARLRGPSLLALCAGCWGLSLWLPFLLFGTLHLAGPFGMLEGLAPAARLPEFIMGMAAGRLFMQLGGVVPAGPRRAAWGAVANALLACMPAVIIAAYGVWFYERHNGLLAPAFALLIVSLAASPRALGQVLASRPLLALGEASYALYLLHIPVLAWFEGPGAPPTLLAPLDGPCSVWCHTDSLPRRLALFRCFGRDQ